MTLDKYWRCYELLVMQRPSLDNIFCLEMSAHKRDQQKKEGKMLAKATQITNLIRRSRGINNSYLLKWDHKACIRFQSSNVPVFLKTNFSGVNN